MLAEIYDSGTGVLEDDQQAARFYKQSAEQGYAPAQYRLGQSYEFGRGVKQDSELALVILGWLPAILAAAQAKMAKIYEAGKDVKTDLTVAADW